MSLGAIANFVLDAIRSPVGGSLINLAAADRQFELNQRAYQDAQSDIARGLNWLRSSGIGTVNPVGLAQELSDYGTQRANELFDPITQAQRFNQALGGVQTGLINLPQELTSTLGDLETLARHGSERIRGDLSREIGELRAGYNQRASQLGTAYGSLFRQAQGLSRGLGQFERSELNRQFDRVAAQQAANLQQRGLSASTASTAVQRGVEAQRARASAGLEERLRREQLGVLGEFGGGSLAARERMTGEALGARQQMSEFGLGLRQGLLGQQLGVGQFAAGLGAQTGLEALAQRGALGQSYLDLMNLASANQLENLYRFGQLPIATGLDTLGMGLGFVGSINRIPGQYYPAVIQPGLS